MSRSVYFFIPRLPCVPRHFPDQPHILDCPFIWNVLNSWKPHEYYVLGHTGPLPTLTFQIVEDKVKLVLLGIYAELAGECGACFDFCVHCNREKMCILQMRFFFASALKDLFSRLRDMYENKLLTYMHGD
jgi:hypothetical protein